MVRRRQHLWLALVAIAITATPCGAGEAISRAMTARNVPDVPPGPITEALSRPLTLYSLPDVPPAPVSEANSRALTLRVLPAPVNDPIQEATSRPLTLRNLPDLPPAPVTAAVSRALTVRNQPTVPPAPITAAISRALTVRVDPQTAAPEAPPSSFALYEAQPNPFNPRTTITFEVPRETRVWIRVYSLRGALVTQLLDGRMVAAGRHQVDWSGRDSGGRSVASGIYYCRMTAKGFSRSVPVTLAK